MPTAKTVQYVTVPINGTVTGDIALVGARAIGILAPALTSCQIFLQGNVDTTSANFMRVHKTDGTGVWSWNVSVGSAGIVVQDILWPFTFARIECSAVQTDVRTFSIITKV